MTRRLLLAAGASALALAGCDRPFVALDPPLVEVVTPDLSEVQTAGRLPIVLRVTSVRGVAQVTVDGAPTSRVTGEDLYVDTLDVAAGLNRYVVHAVGADGNEARDTLFVLRAEIQSALVASGDLPEPRAAHATTLLQNGSLVVTGGVGPGGEPYASAYGIRETSAFSFDVAPAGSLALPRAGHSAHSLPDGRVLILGGSSRAEPATETDFVDQAEIYDPQTGLSAAIPSRGDPVRRSGHIAFQLQSAGRTYLYLVGGRGPLGEGVGTPASVVIAELRGAAGADTLVTLTPAGGAGILEPVTAPAGLLLSSPPNEPRALLSGLYLPELLAVDSRLRFLPGSGLYPFQVLEEPVAPPEEPRDDAALAPMDPSLSLAVLLGGRMAAGATARFSLFAVAASRWFSVPTDRAGLRVNRFGHTATLLPSGRIAVLGGFTQPGAPTATTELISID
jgi:hypothetical protein